MPEVEPHPFLWLLAIWVWTVSAEWGHSQQCLSASSELPDSSRPEPMALQVSTRAGWSCRRKGWEASGQLPGVGIVLVDPGCSRKCIINPVEYWPSKAGRAVSQGLESFWQSLSAPVLSRREPERGAQNFADRADGDTVGTEDIRADGTLYVSLCVLPHMY